MVSKILQGRITVTSLTLQRRTCKLLLVQLIYTLVLGMDFHKLQIRRQFGASSQLLFNDIWQLEIRSGQRVGYFTLHPLK
jgi:hypothetical protein